MSLAKGVITSTVESGDGPKFSISGAADYAWPEVNGDLDEVKTFIHTFSSDAMRIDEFGCIEKNIRNLSVLRQKLIEKHSSKKVSLAKLRQHESHNKTAMTSIIAEMTAMESNIRDCQNVLRRVVGWDLIKDEEEDKDGDFKQEFASCENGNVLLLSSFASSHR